MSYKSETSKVRSLVVPFLKGRGIDIGFGGDKIDKSFIGSDLENGYADTGTDFNDLPSDISQGISCDDEVFDTVYSSHLIEDFKDTYKVLAEHLRILKVGGTLILVFPDEKKYRRHCLFSRQPVNTHHVHEHMSVWFMLSKLMYFDIDLKMVSNCVIDYNVIIVVEKKSNDVYDSEKTKKA